MVLNSVKLFSFQSNKTNQLYIINFAYYAYVPTFHLNKN